MELGREKGERHCGRVHVGISVYVGWAGGEGAIVSQEGNYKATGGVCTPKRVQLPSLLKGRGGRGGSSRAHEGFDAVFRIRIHFIRIRIQNFRLNTDPDPGSGSNPNPAL
jgi:hypothetical protein